MDTTQDDTLQLPDTIPHDLASVLHGFASVFAVPTGLPPFHTQDHSIVLQEGVNAVKVLPYCYPVSQKAQIETMVADMLAQGLIQPSSSPFLAYVILVRKKDGTWHFCTDYHALNAVTIKDSYPMPTVDELLDELHGAQFYSKLDLRSGYHLIILKPEDHYKTAFHTHHGLYEWLVMPFGLTNAPTIAYMPSFLSVHLVKNGFEYLGHVVTGAGVEMDHAKVTAVANWPLPTSVLSFKNNFKWSQEAQSAFETLKQALQTTLVLVLMDFSKPFIVETDASGHGIGAILSQAGYPIAFFSKKLSRKMQEASTYVRELFAITEAYKAGASNDGADGLSRCFNFSLSTSHASIVEDIRDALATSSSISSIIFQVEKDPIAMSTYEVKNGFLYRKNRMVIPPESRDLITRLLLRMRRDIRDYVRALWEDVAMDTGLPNSCGYIVIMVVIDRLSKYAHFAPFHSQFSAPQVATLFAQTIVKLHGLPQSIVSDRDKIFTSTFWSHIFKLQDTSLQMSSAYHPQSDGQSKVLNKCLELYLRCFVSEQPKARVDYLPWAEYWYNSAFQTSISVTPFKVVYGRDPPSIITRSFSDDTPRDVIEQLQKRDA
ncbi:ty3-gypsy retrotransposon protein [Tanacetum coccineum]